MKNKKRKFIYSKI